MKMIPTAYCKVCEEPIYKGDGKPDKKGMWTCRVCLIDMEKGKC
jgi:hypothetical protein